MSKGVRAALDRVHLAAVAAARGILRRRRWQMAAKAASPARYVRVAALVLIGALMAGPLATHVYWLFGGTWGLYSNGVHDEVASMGLRMVAAVVVVLLVAAVLVVLAHVGWWKQRLVSDRVIRVLVWALAAFFLLETLAALTWSRD